MPKIDYTVLHDLINFVTHLGWHVTATTGGKHNVGSLHYIGHAVDVSFHGKTDANLHTLQAEAARHGYKVRDERARPAGQKVWGGSHIHVEKPL